MATGSTYLAAFSDSTGVQTRLEGNLTYLSDTAEPLPSSGAAIVTVGSAAPSPIDTFVTYLVFDDTASTGGLYAWDGTQYQQVGPATS